MNLEELTRRFRVMAKDDVEPYLFSDEDVADWLTDAEREAAIRGRLLLDDYTPAVCEIAIVPGTASYAMHPKLYELASVRFKPDGDTRSEAIQLVSREWLDDCVRDWRDMEEGQQRRRYAIQSETSIRLVPAPRKAGTLLMEGYRLPLKPLANDTDRPELHEASHEKLLHWALHKAFSIPDSETFDPERSDRAEAAFTRHFGLMPDADMRRITREDTVQHNTAYPP